MKTRILWTVPSHLMGIEEFGVPTILLVDCMLEPKTELPKYNVPRNTIRVASNAIINSNHEDMIIKFTCTSSAPLLNTLRALYPDAEVQYDLPSKEQS